MIRTLLFIPLFGGLLSFMIASDRLRRAVLVLTALCHFTAVFVLWNKGFAPLGDTWLGIDALGLLFLLIASTLFLMAAVYTVGYLAGHPHASIPDKRFSRESIFTGSFIFFLGTMTLAIMSQHVGVFWMAIESTTLASAPLISYQHSPRSLEAAWKYLLICSVGIALALIGNLALVVSAAFDPALHGLPMTFGALADHAGALQSTWIKGAFVFFLVGYGTKMGLAPMHTWLPDAHSESPSPVSALLSGALLNCAFLGILRVHIILGKAGLAMFSNQLLMGLGLLSMFLAGWFIVQQTNFKRLLAYSSIEHMGILAIAAGAGTQTHFGAMLHAMNHSLTKGMLFLIAGNILAAFGTKTVSRVTGIIRVMPISGILWIAGFLSICGVPPFGTFVSEFSILYGLGQSGHWIVMALMLLALGIIFVGMFRILIPMAYGEPSQELPVSPENGWYVIPPLILGAAVLVLGCWIPQPLNRLFAQAASLLGAY
ncbi:MAG: proton-conducting transporter membrane subunit [Desulfoplanes sp.]